ncbi:hypothetical protein CVT25_009606 [Psilocybe cyanescens]|uniref:DUF726-domain-containing protein n=1 Tax=Psilocybe cyanescens TaxID=93625 RepID=A0A409XGT3_PSICY|nr:hypothetical protein CVT25_009606 [Psilocybe cyanescens]
MPVTSFPPPKDVFDDDDDEGWQDMPIVREDTSASGLDEEDLKKYHYQASTTNSKTAANATGNLIDVDDLGNEWRSKLDQNESEYTRLRVNEEDEVDEVHLRTRYLFDEDKAMTPLSQMQATKNLLTEAQRIAYVGLCALASREMVQNLKVVHRKELKASISNMELWALKIMGRLYYHMELETQEQKMIESLAEHGVLASDLVPALMTTHTVANPEYDPEEARRQAEEAISNPPPQSVDDNEEDEEGDDISISDQTLVNQPLSKSDSDGNKTPTSMSSPQQGFDQSNSPGPLKQVRTTAKVLQESSTAAIAGVTTSLSSTDQNVTLDIRWTVLCDLFLTLIADSVYDARSRVLLEQVAYKLGLGWLDVVKFESRVTQALEIQEDVETLEQQGVVEGARKAGNKRRYMMLGLATIGGGLVIGLSAGLLAPVIGLGLAGALTTVGVTGTGAFLGGAAGAAVITTGGVLTGSGIAVRGMVKRTQQVRTFDILPLHNNKRVNCILTVPGFMNGMNDDVRLPFSVLDPIVGDVFSVLWEPEMIRETGSALKILTGEVLSQIGMTVLQATVMTGLMSALQWPIILTKLGYLIDNPWSNALDRAKSAGKVLADVLINRHLGVRPITLIGFSLGARVIFYALLELAKQKQFGIVQDVFLLGATLTVSQKTWCETRSVVSGRYVNAFARNDWVLNYLFRATSGTVGTVAGLRPIEGVPGLENVDVTDKIAGHMSYRTFMPLILDQLGFPVFSDYFDEPEEPDFDEDRIVVREEDNQKKSGWFSRKKTNTTPQKHVSRPPSTSTFAGLKHRSQSDGSSSKDAPGDDDDLPPRMDSSSSKATDDDNVTLAGSGSGRNTPTPSRPSTPSQDPSSSSSHLPLHAGFDLSAIKSVLNEVEQDPSKAALPQTTPTPAKSLLTRLAPPPVAPPSTRSQSTPPFKMPETSSHLRSSSLDYEYGNSPTDDRDPFGRPANDDPTPSSFSKSLSLSSSPSSSSSRLDTMSGLSSTLSSSSSYASSSFYNSKTPTASSSFNPFSHPADNDDDQRFSLPTPRVTTTYPLASLPDDSDIVPSWGTTSSSFANSSSSSSSYSSHSATTSNIPYNPFSASAVASMNTNTNTPAFSFGGSDGPVVGSSASQDDAWSIPPLSAKKKTALDGFNANPWS